MNLHWLSIQLVIGIDTISPTPFEYATYEDEAKDAPEEGAELEDEVDIARGHMKSDVADRRDNRDVEF